MWRHHERGEGVPLPLDLSRHNNGGVLLLSTGGGGEDQHRITSGRRGAFTPVYPPPTRIHKVVYWFSAYLFFYQFDPFATAAPLFFWGGGEPLGIRVRYVFQYSEWVNRGGEDGAACSREEVIPNRFIPPAAINASDVDVQSTGK